ncbi:tautomerase family protein [Campylobacter fetus]|uniref:Tautomerase n=1 Tax=Campylobacter fetus subsp. testudinum TaxID=1507806 RepID=A0AAX0HCP5_CAMFE|nr:4-oxalocrotonate tautomerase family protein [Campylobacter fetus]AGZ82278.1 4-oxalocrotonate tautomerase family enzyme [Campylobacter fetus subsp. testudinum 03-427]AJB46003.1 tautomerase [Campylobacter fetus subsp. testudinum]ALV65447.1 4-oxalocrotonate tautomerase family enzyme [Campylobacter fetus subsp. testudinum Sp3]AVK81692.1 tautomerase [Campylobacter fetus subsp. testudinum]EAI4322084.1 4-oxalocrotonate tautomerase family protein [Campylobacter fetus]
MPYVNIKVTKENGEPTIAQKEELIKGVTELLHNVLGRNKASTVVVIDEIETENYGLGGESIKIKRKREEKR